MTTSPYDDHWDNIYHHILRKFYMNSFFRSLTGNCLLGVIFAIMIGNGASADMNMENGRKCLGNYISDRGATLTVEKIESDLLSLAAANRRTLNGKPSRFTVMLAIILKEYLDTKHSKMCTKII